MVGLHDLRGLFQPVILYFNLQNVDLRCVCTGSSLYERVGNSPF